MYNHYLYYSQILRVDKYLDLCLHVLSSRVKTQNFNIFCFQTYINICFLKEVVIRVYFISGGLRVHVNMYSFGSCLWSFVGQVISGPRSAIPCRFKFQLVNPVQLSKYP